MATENKGKSISIPAGSDLSAKQFRFVTVDSSGELATTGDGAVADGVLQDKPAAQGRVGEVMVGAGKTKIKCGGTCSIGNQAASDANGEAVNAITGDAVLGRFLETGASGEVIELLYIPPSANSLG